MSLPDYIKISNKQTKGPWTKVNPKAFDELKTIGAKLFNYGVETYLVGSAVGGEESESVGDLDLIVFVNNPMELLNIENSLRGYKKLAYTDLKVRYQFYLKNQINPYLPSPQFNPHYYTAVKVKNIVLSNSNTLEASPWLSREVVENSCRASSLDSGLFLFRIIHKQKLNVETNHRLIKYVRDLITDSMFLKGYFGFSKTELYELFPKVYPEVDTFVPNLMLKTRSKGLEYFSNQEPKKLQDQVLKFAYQTILCTR